jgi:penicillin-binding protein 2
VGRGGIEGFENCGLKGTDGKRLIEVDAKGNYVRELGRQEPAVANDLNLSIDAYWQEKIYKMLDGKKAVVIISEPKTGKIINFVSSPSFDPNVFSYIQDNEKIANYLNDKENFPLLNRVISAKYHPGSVFKPVIATAGLESGVIDKETLFEDTGILKVGDYSYSNWLWTKSGRTDGMLNIVTAIKRSNDIFFYKLGEALGLERIDTWAKKFGYGKKTGVEISGELDGLVPDEKWKKEVKGESWYLGNTYHLSIGQGDLEVTPLQVNQMTNVVANGGVKCKMSILKDSKIECTDLKIKKSNIAVVLEGMKAACKSGGTAWPLFNFKTEIACKTGTAEVGDGSKDTQAWLTAFAPADDPQISITVLVERGGEGSDVAAPIVGDILKEWFNEPDTLVPRYTEKKEVSE